MMDHQPRQAQYRLALQELHSNRHVFTPQALGPIILTLNRALRKAATLPQHLVAASDAIRLVTVLFVDVSDSTRIARQMDTSDWKHLLAQAHQQLATIVTSWGGEVGQYLGDGLLCYFGAQRSGGDDASRAVASAMAMQAAMDAYAKVVYEQHKEPFSIRIGVTTGRLVVGMVGSEGHQSMLALGPATNLAARLQSFARPGQVLIDAATYSRVRRQFVCEALRPQQIKGFDEAVRPYHVTGQRSPSDALFVETSINGIDVPFVGREETLAYLLEASQDVLEHQRARFIMLAGDAGVGNSRLLQELITRSEDQPIRVFPIITSYEKRTQDYNLLRYLLMSECDISEDMPKEVARERVRKCIKDVWPRDYEAAIAAETISYLAGFSEAESENIRALKRNTAFRQRAYTWIAQWLQVLAGKSAILLLIDNVQWADVESYEWLSNMTQYLSASPACIVVARRTGEDMDPMSQLNVTGTVDQISLEALPAGDIKQVIDAVLQHVRNAPRQLSDRIVDRAQGNPLFVTESLTMLFDNGVFQPGQGQMWRVDMARYDDAIAAMPHGLLGILQARLDELTPDAYNVIQVAAIIGDTFWDGCIREMLDRPDVSVALDQLEERGFILRAEESVLDDEQEYTFRQSLYRKVAYDMVPRALRESYHSQVAQWLVVRVATHPELYVTLAEHFEAASRHEAALFTYLEVAQDLFKHDMLYETLAYVQRGLALTGKVAREEALPVASQLWLLQGQALNGLWRHPEASAACESALMLLDEMPEDNMRPQRTLAARNLASAYRCMGQYEKAHDALQKAFETVDEQNTSEYASLLASSGSLALYRGFMEEALHYEARLLALDDASLTNATRNGVTTLRGLIAAERGQLGDALLLYQQVLKYNSEHNFIYYMIKDLFNIGRVYMDLCSYERALLIFDEADALLRKHRGHHPLIYAYRGLALMELGQVEAGVSELQATEALQQSDVYHHQLLQLAIMRGLLLTGSYHDCIAKADVFIQMVHDDNALLAGRAMFHRAQANHHLGHVEAARSDMMAVMSAEQMHGGRYLWACYASMAHLAPSPEEYTRYMRLAADNIREIAQSLDRHPGLQQAFRNAEAVQAVLIAERNGIREK